MSIHAVISGDIIRSTQHGTSVTDAAIRCLHRTAQQLEEWTDATRFTRFRGDGWQLFIADPSLALHSTISLLANLKAANLGVETRMAIGFGTVERIGTIDLADAAGEAFQLAGEGLDQMPSYKRVALTNWTVLQDWHHAVFDLAVWIASRWTPAQAEAVALAISPTQELTQAEIATQLHITRQAVQLRLSGAGWDALQTSLDAVRRHNWEPHTHA